ncbi:MAG: type II secretion system protein GspD [Candidatus Omnitrophota bacterium]
MCFFLCLVLGLSSGSANAQTGPVAPAQATETNGVISLLDFKNMEMTDVLKYLSQKSQYNFVPSQSVKSRVTIYLKDVEVLEAMEIIARSQNLAYVIDGKVIHVMTAKEYEQEFGYPYGKPVVTEYMQMAHINPGRAVEIIEKMKGPMGIVYVDLYSKSLMIKDEPARIEEMKKAIAMIDRPLITKEIRLKYIPVKDIAEKIKDLTTPSIGSVKYDEPSNSMVIMDNADVIDRIKSVVRTFDQRQSEVSIEAKIIQVTLSDDTKLGVNWQAVIKEFHDMKVESDFEAMPTGNLGRLSVGTIEKDNYSAVVNALESVGNTKILSNPHITTLNNKEAKILVGSSEPYVTATTTTPSSGPAITAENVTFIDVGVKLYATPTIHDDGYITMAIRPEVSSVTRTVTTSNNNSIPVVETSEAETTVMIRDGETIVIGGLIREDRIDTVQQVPVLGDIPVVGSAFRNKDHTNRTTEIVIFLTPRIINGTSQEYRDYRSILE